MLRSTSVKNDQWKPVKLLARQTLDSNIISSSSSSSGELVAVLTSTHLNVFSNRELLEKVSLNNGKRVCVIDKTSTIFALTNEKLFSYNYWGKVRWHSANVNDESHLSVSEDGENVILTKEKNLCILNRFGDIISQFDFDSKIRSVKQVENKIIILLEDTIKIFENFKEVREIKAMSCEKLSCSEDSIMAIYADRISSLSYSGSELWSREELVNHFNFSNKGIKHVYVKNFNTLISQDRNGELQWEYPSRENFDGVKVINSGHMIGIYSNQAFHVIDKEGNQAWSYQAREKIINVLFSNHGGDIILVSESRIHWFQNEGFLRLEIEDALNSVENLFEKVSIYESNLESVFNDIQKAKSLQSSNFTSIKKSFQLIYGVQQRLLNLQQRHVGYLDALPSFLDNLGLRGAQTDEMIPLLYPYYSFHSDLQNISFLESTVKLAESSISKLNRFGLQDSDNNKNNQVFVKDAKIGVKAEIDNLHSISKSIEKDLLSLEKKIKNLILAWLETGTLDSKPQSFLSAYQKSSDIRNFKVSIINDRIENHMAFVDYKSDNILLELTSKFFSASEFVKLSLNIKNITGQKVDNIFLRIKVDGSGLSINEPQSGVIRFDHLRAGESFSPFFTFVPLNNSMTRIALILQYDDESGRTHTNWLGEAESNFLGCHIRPNEISLENHDTKRLEYKDSTSHTVINVEGLSMKKISSFAKNIVGLHLSGSKEEDTRSILYHSAVSTLDDSSYLSMIFLRYVGSVESMRTAIEIICHAENSDKSSELKEEILSYLKSKLLEANGRLV